MKDLGAELGLSVSVVSRVLNGKAAEFRIREETQQLVREAATRHGFSVNQVARGLRLQRTYTIGLLIPDISNSFFSKIAQSVESAARRQGYSIILCDTENDEEIEQESLKLLRDRAVDGLLIAPVGRESKHIKAVHQAGLPIVLIDRFFDNTKIPYVTSNNYRGAYEGVDHLIKMGHRSIGYIQGIPDSKPNLERLRGYRDALRDGGQKNYKHLIYGHSFEEEDGYLSAKALLESDKRPTALFASSSVGALGVMRACNELGLNIPKDVSLIGFDEYPYAPLLSPPLSTIAQRTKEIGESASTLLLDWLESGEQPKNTTNILDTHLVCRSSVVDLKVNDTIQNRS